MNNEDALATTTLILSSSLTVKQPASPKANWLPYILMFISTLIQGFSTFYAKYIIQHTSGNYDVITFLFIRSFPIVIGSYISFKVQKDPLLKPIDIPHKKWFILRANLSFFSLVFFILSLRYLRCSTTQVILTITQITATFISILFFHERLSNSLLIGIFICGIGVVLVALNEFNKDDTSVVIKGLFYSFVSVLLFIIVVISNKKVSLNQISVNNHTFYQGLTTMGYSIAYLLLTLQLSYSIGYVIMCLLHGVFFVVGQSLSSHATRLDPKNKVNRLNHFQIVYVFVLSYLFLSEAVYFTDWVGGFFIISFLLYHSIYLT